MPAIGIVVAWFGYTLTLWGYSLVRGYNVKFTDLANPVHFYSGPWPPPQNIPADTILPNGLQGTAATTTRTKAGKPANSSVFAEPGVPGINAGKGR